MRMYELIMLNVDGKELQKTEEDEDFCEKKEFTDYVFVCG